MVSSKVKQEIIQNLATRISNCGEYIETKQAEIEELREEIEDCKRVMSELEQYKEYKAEVNQK